MTNFDIQRESEQIEQGVSAARKKLLQAAENRFQYQVEQSQQPAPVYYDGRNRIKPLGANNSYSARGIQANAPLGVGDRVAEQGGLVQATPRSGGENRRAARLQRQLDNHGKLLRSLLPPAGQIGNGDPNAQTVPGTIDVPARFANDRYINLDSGLHYYWDATAGEWKLIPIREEADGHIPEAEDGAITVIAGSAVDLKILDITTLGTGTGTLSTAPGNTLTAGNSLTLTLSGTDGSAFSWTLGLMRV